MMSRINKIFPIFRVKLFATASLAILSMVSNANAAVLTSSPALEGSRLFVRAADINQNVAGFEFCCSQYDTYQKYGFTDATGDFLKLDGGFWGAGVQGAVGQRVFSSYGDGANPGGTVAQLGNSATGTIMSPEFDITTNYINFLIGGGSNRFDANNPTAVVLVVDGKVVRQSHGKNEQNRVVWDSWDVSELKGKKGKIKFIDGHPANGSDNAVPYILADEFRAADKAAVQPASDSTVGALTASNPATVGSSLFIRASNPSQNIAGFEFCCAQYDTYQKHDFTNATGDFLKLDGGFWAAGVQGAIGDRVFSSYGDGANNTPGAVVAQLGNSATGTIMSPEFDITSNYINFLIGGGSNRFDAVNPTAVVLVVDGNVVRQSHGKNEVNKVVWDSWDVSELKGRKGKIKFIDGHPANGSDNAVPYILADEFRAADIAAVQPASDSKVSSVSIPMTQTPATAGSSLFIRISNPSQNIAGFEFCCAQYDTYQKHDFTDATGDFLKLDGGFWGAGVQGAVGQRVFSSYGDGANPGGTVAQLGNSATGTIMSPEFDITTNYINFLIGGGSNRFDTTNPTAVVLVVDGKIVRQSHGKNEQNKLVWDSWDVSVLKGRKGKIKFIDGHPANGSDSAVPYILADEFRGANEAAVQPASDSVVSVDAVIGTRNLKLDMGDANPFYKDGEYYIYYLANTGYHSWEMVKTADLMTSTPSVVVLPASGDASKIDQWIGSGSVMKDQNNNYHLFATGHNENLRPMEATLHATATDATLTHWAVQSNETFSGAGGYSTNDFRDPLVFWNATAQKYWMVITTRYQGNAAIGLMSSSNLSQWTPEAPLYTEASPLNLEVADYFALGQSSFMVYSDQRDESRQVEYLMKNGSGWTKPNYDALDGKSYYAARTAGTDAERLLFGWVAHKTGRVDTGTPEWGGDLMIHQVKKLTSGELAVSLPQKIVTALSTVAGTDAVWSNASISGAMTSRSLAPNTRVTMAESNVKNRLSFNLTSSSANAIAGVQLRNPMTGKLAFVKIDSQNDKATFYFDGDESNPNNPSVKLPLDYSQGVKLDVFMDPIAGVAAVYINDFRALSFRLYDLKNYQVGVFTTGDTVSLTNIKRYTK